MSPPEKEPGVVRPVDDACANRYDPAVLLPFDRQRLRDRSDLDERDELVAARDETPEERFLLSLELSELTRELAQAAGADWTTHERDDLPEKSRAYALPLRVAMDRRT
jgi:hypothetical protein